MWSIARYWWKIADFLYPLIFGVPVMSDLIVISSDAHAWVNYRVPTVLFGVDSWWSVLIFKYNTERIALCIAMLTRKKNDTIKRLCSLVSYGIWIVHLLVSPECDRVICVVTRPQYIRFLLLIWPSTVSMKDLAIQLLRCQWPVASFSVCIDLRRGHSSHYAHTHPLKT